MCGNRRCLLLAALKVSPPVGCAANGGHFCEALSVRFLQNLYSGSFSFSLRVYPSSNIITLRSLFRIKSRIYHSSRVRNLENYHQGEAVSDHSWLVAKLACILDQVLSTPGGGGREIPEVSIRSICQSVRRTAGERQTADIFGRY